MQLGRLVDFDPLAVTQPEHAVGGRLEADNWRGIWRDSGGKSGEIYGETSELRRNREALISVEEIGLLQYFQHKKVPQPTGLEVRCSIQLS